MLYVDSSGITRANVERPTRPFADLTSGPVNTRCYDSLLKYSALSPSCLYSYGISSSSVNNVSTVTRNVNLQLREGSAKGTLIHRAIMNRSFSTSHYALSIRTMSQILSLWALAIFALIERNRWRFTVWKPQQFCAVQSSKLNPAAAPVFVVYKCATWSNRLSWWDHLSSRFLAG